MLLKKISINLIDDNLVYKSILFSREFIHVFTFIATYICWEAELNKLLRLLYQSLFMISV